MDKFIGILEATSYLGAAYLLGYPLERLCYYLMIKPYASVLAKSTDWQEYNKAWDAVNRDK